jgi:hypothetical protein
MDIVKKPLFIVLLAAAALTIVGAVMGWFSIGSQFVRMMAEDELAKKQSLAIAITLVSLALSAGAVLAKKQRIALGAVAVSIYGLIMIVNQKPDADVIEKIALTVNPGYWLSIIGTLVMIIASVIIGAKGIDFLTKKK